MAQLDRFLAAMTEYKAEALVLEQARMRGFDDADGFERTAAARRRVRTYIPTETGPVRSYGLVCLAAQRAGVAPDRLEVGELVDCGLLGPADRVVERIVRLGGRSTLSELVALVESLRQLGMPTAVRDLTISRESPRDPRFHFVITLGLIHLAPFETATAEVGA